MPITASPAGSKIIAARFGATNWAMKRPTSAPSGAPSPTSAEAGPRRFGA